MSSKKHMALQELKHIPEMFREDLHETEKKMTGAKAYISAAQLITLRSAHRKAVDAVNQLGDAITSIAIEK